ncbi:14377_t:CDS:10, partial [Funneliformis mosseae]
GQWRLASQSRYTGNIMQGKALSTHTKGNIPAECFQTSDTGSNGRMPHPGQGLEHACPRKFLQTSAKHLTQEAMAIHRSDDQTSHTESYASWNRSQPKTELSEYIINNTLKDDLYSLLQSLGGKCYANERNVASASTLQALEEHRTARTEIENIRNANVKEATELVPLKRKSSYPHEVVRKKTIVVDNDNEKDYESMWNVHKDTSTNENEQVSSSTTNEKCTVMMESPRQILPCILKSNENFTNVWDKYLLKIELNPWSLEHDCIVKTFRNDVLKSRLKPIFQENENDKRSLLQKFARVWVDIGENEITMFEQYALLVTHIFISEFESKRNIISHPSTTEAMWSTVELDSTALRKDGGRDILTLPKVSTGHKGDGTGLSDDGHESFVLEISFAPQNQDRRKTAEK